MLNVHNECKASHVNALTVGGLNEFCRVYSLQILRTICVEFPTKISQDNGMIVEQKIGVILFFLYFKGFNNCITCNAVHRDKSNLLLACIGCSLLVEFINIIIR